MVNYKNHTRVIMYYMREEIRQKTRKKQNGNYECLQRVCVERSESMNKGEEIERVRLNGERSIRRKRRQRQTVAMKDCRTRLTCKSTAL